MIVSLFGRKRPTEPEPAKPEAESLRKELARRIAENAALKAGIRPAPHEGREVGYRVGECPYCKSWVEAKIYEREHNPDGVKMVTVRFMHCPKCGERPPMP